jgi:hypothetical protein
MIAHVPVAHGASHGLKGMKKSKRTKKEGSKAPKMVDAASARMADSSTAYTYQRMATDFLTEIDNIANEEVEDLDEFYETRIAAFSTDDVVWDIDTGARKFQVEGKEPVRGLWDNFAGRQFAFHRWSHFAVNEVSGGGIEVALRYHLVGLEAEGNYNDIFGVIKVNYDEDDLVDYVFVQRLHAIDRGYAPSME